MAAVGKLPVCVCVCVKNASDKLKRCCKRDKELTFH